MFANYHTHSYRCHHAQGTDRQYVEAAIDKGIKVLGFSDHCPWIYPDGYESGMRMNPEETKQYMDSLQSLKKEYENDLKIYIGFEEEYVPEALQAQDEFLENYPVDYRILGQHFLGFEMNAPYMGSPTDDETVLSRYVDTCIAGLETGRYLYLAHPDLINFTGEETVYRYHIQRLCEKAKELDIPLELNVLGAYQGRHYPNDRFWELAGNLNNSCIIGIDAHDPAMFFYPQGFQKIEDLAKRYKLHVIDEDLLQKS